MKKISLLLMVCIILMTFASCAKKCRCTYKEIRNGRVISKETEVWENLGMKGVPTKIGQRQKMESPIKKFAEVLYKSVFLTK